MSPKTKKMIAPIVVTILVILYYCVYFGIIIHFIGTLSAVLLGVIPLILSGAMLYVCIERIREIKGGEEDDLSQY